MLPRVREYRPGERVPGTVYGVVRLIGEGGMGTVYEVEDTTIGKRYVLKTLHPQLGEREDLARRMQREARQLARLNHANIVEVITAGVTSDDLRLPYYVMERLNGQSLRVVLETKGQLELPHAYHIGIDLFDALDHAHDKGIIHRDVKPDNIFLHRTPAGVTVTKLLDFGILSRLDGPVGETAGRFLGTLRYSAPEQLRGEKPTPQVDVYAAGLVLYEMIAGRGPFDDEGDEHAIGAAHMDKTPPLLSRFVAVPPALEALVMASIAKAPEDRPRDAFSFAATLRELKRTVVGSPWRESTESRATVPAVIGRESAMAPFVEVRRPLVDGSYVISPVREPIAAAQTSFPKTTLHGVALPTLGPPLADAASSSRTVTTPDAVDRMARTNSFVPDTIARPQHGTEALIGADDRRQGGLAPTSPPSEPAEGRGESPFRWVDERAPAPSEASHAQTLTVGAPRSSRSAARILGAATLLGTTAIVATIVFGRHPPSPKARVEEMPAQGPVVGAPLAVEQPAAPAPPSITSASPSGKVSSSAFATAAAPSARAPAPSPALIKARPLASAASKPTLPAPLADRPGPGF